MSHAHAIPVFVDIDPLDLNIDVSRIEGKDYVAYQINTTGSYCWLSMRYGINY
ncbi:TPA: hypothetical protein EYN98_31030 [Candidatus Poribacteria bacterium]|nr:hypothetical protein [Candidatus Poribacteria bacterium]HIB88378.1 hypothetical protein [Candidatus Poribacteria bacterium]HIC02952.1 hypothetical protein [Candidatus Poribacteria bacterium]HIC18608.1 hypothetical protein [Candidatus Poribacteria bacterium]HIM09617.1 hypothetical protein [Candidatus Poribacteria bacterium]